MLSQDFYGKKGFVWWIGVVEDDYDPLLLGRARVRIIGVHSDDTSLVPTENLPWAQTLKQPSAYDVLICPKVGEWVFGFFQDGEYAQIPVVIGTFTGIESEQSRTIYETYTVRSGGENAVPKPSTQALGATITDTVKVGEPTTPKTARNSIEGTIVAVTNSIRSGKCDLRPEVDKALSYLKGQFNLILEKLRETIRAVLGAIGLYPDGASSYLIQFLKQAAAIVRKIARMLDEITREISKLKYLFQLINNFLSYVASLPERLAKVFEDCVAKFQKLVTDFFISILSPPELNFNTGIFNELTSAFKDLGNSFDRLVSTTASTLAMPARMIKSLTAPSKTTTSQSIQALGGTSGDELGNMNETELQRNMNGHVNAVNKAGTKLYNRRAVMTDASFGCTV